MELIRAFSAAVSPPFQPLETAGAGAGGSEFLWENYLINKAKKTVGFPVDRLEKIQAAFTDWSRRKRISLGELSDQQSEENRRLSR